MQRSYGHYSLCQALQFGGMDVGPFSLFDVNFYTAVIFSSPLAVQGVGRCLASQFALATESASAAVTPIVFQTIPPSTYHGSGVAYRDCSVRLRKE